MLALKSLILLAPGYYAGYANCIHLYGKGNFMISTVVVFCEDIPHGRLAY